MLEAIRQVEDYTAGLDLDDFKGAAIVVDAVLYRFSVLGEAANAVPEEVRAEHPEVPWRAMRGMRNRLVHEYFGVRHETVWETVHSELPGLRIQLRAIADSAASEE